MTLDCTIMGILTNITFSSQHLQPLPRSNIFALSSILSIGQSLYAKLKKNELYHHVSSMLEAASLPNSRYLRSVLFKLTSFTEISHQGATLEK